MIETILQHFPVSGGRLFLDGATGTGVVLLMIPVAPKANLFSVIG